MKILSLFDGMSCGMIALERAGISVEKYYASEIDKYSQIVSNANYPDIIRLGDITKWQEWDIEQPDIIMAGSPCQGFSFAGKQLNFKDERSKLFFVFVDILKYYKPKYFLLENVVMAKEHNDVISEILGDMYTECVDQPELFRTGRFEPVKINSALVSAQNRNRLYWTNIQGIKQPKDRKIYLKDIIENGTGILNDNGTWREKNDKSNCIDANYYKGVDNHAQRTMVKCSTDEKTNCLTAVQKDNMVVKFDKHDSKNELKCIAGLNKNKKWLDNGKTLQRNFSQGERIYSTEGKSPTLSANSGGTAGGGSALIGIKCLHMGYRKLTPQECEQLQTVNTIYEMDVELCIGQAKNFVNAVNKSHKLQKFVLSVEKTELKEFAKFVELNMKQKSQKIKFIVPQNVNMQIQKKIKKCTNHNQKENNINADIVEKKTMCSCQDIEEDFVIQNVFTNITREKIINAGKVEFPLKEKNLYQAKNGKKLLKLYGKEIMQLVKIADIITEKQEIDKCTFTTLYHLNILSIDQMLITLYWFAKNVITLSIQKRIKIKNLLLNYNFENSFTNHVSNSQRYKMLGNGWTVDVISHIFSFIKLDKVIE